MIPVICVVAVFDVPLYLTNTSLFIQQYLGLFWGVVTALIFLNTPPSKRITKEFRVYDVIAAALSLGLGIYVALFGPRLLAFIAIPSGTVVILGGLGVLLLLESLRRKAGLPLLIIILVFIAYAKFGSFAPSILHIKSISWSRLLTQLFLGGEFMLGLPLRVAVLIVFAFIFFGEVLFKVGGGQFFIDIAMSVMGGFRGGPAKVSVLSSSLFGTISGSAVANVMVDGWFTIPLMKKTGYPAYFAGAVEATASTGGQIMPPVMGAAAFIIADFLQIPYSTVAISAFVPALAYYFGLYMQLDLRAGRLGLKGLARHELPSLKKTLREGWVFIFPLLVLIVTIFVLFLRPEIGALYASGVVVIVTFLKKKTRAIWSWKTVSEILRETSHSMLEVTAICAGAGIVVGIVGYTGLGLSFSRLMTMIAGGNVFLLAVLTAAASTVLGMGMPTTSAYILLAVLAAPAMVSLGMNPLIAHLFIFYFGTLSMLTPPVCLAAYAAASIAEAPMAKVGLQSVKLAIAAYLVPFMFIYKTGILLIGSVGEIVYSIVTTFCAIFAISVFLERYLVRQQLPFSRGILFAIVAVALIVPFPVINGAGMVSFILLLLFHLRRRERRKEAAAPS